MRGSIGCVLASLVLVLFVAQSVAAVEDCSDLARIPQCPFATASCGGNPCQVQDCFSCTPGFDDDGDGAVDEELLNGSDDDGDGFADEDISCLNGCDPLNAACKQNSDFPSGELTAPAPVEALVRFSARVDAWHCKD